MIKVSINNQGGDALRALMKQVKNTKYNITLGFYSTAVYEGERQLRYRRAQGKKRKKSTEPKVPPPIPVPVVARINNYGYVNPKTGVRIPPRPFLTTMPYTHGKQWKQLFQKVTSTHVDLSNYKQSLRVALGIIALQMKADLQRNITDWRTPPNSPVTIALKDGKDNPLVHEGILRAAAAFQIKIT